MKYRCWDDSSNEEWPAEGELEDGADVDATSAQNAALKFADDLSEYDRERRVFAIVVRDDLGQYYSIHMVRDWRVTLDRKTTLAELRGTDCAP